MQHKLIRSAVAVPVAVASALWTAHLVAPTDSPPALAPQAAVRPLPAALDDIVVPDREAGFPASISPPEAIRSASDGRFATIASRPSAGDIPATALAAYQRAESLIGSADASCHLSWQLIAAIGRVESDHGRFDGSAVGEDGVSRPAIVGPVLDGTNGTAAVRDTDAGKLDGDVDFDHAVGPLQFIPSTWSVVGVDGDADGTRDPQDIDDAALAAAVYLCAGEGDLATSPGRRAAVFTYNHSTAYVDQVLAIMAEYLVGNAVIPTTNVVNAGMLVPLVPLGQQSTGAARQGDASAAPGGSGAQVAGIERTGRGPRTEGTIDQAPAGTATQATPPPGTQPSEPAPTPTDPAEEPAAPTEEPSAPAEDSAEPSPEPTGQPAEPQEPTQDPAGTPATPLDACELQGYVDDPATSDDAYDICLATYDDSGDGSGDEPADGPSQAPEPVATSSEDTPARPAD